MELLTSLWDAFLQFISILLNLDQYLGQWVASWGVWTYVVLGLVIFCETGLVFLPFLPGDSLLFAVGALAAREETGLSVTGLITVMSACAILGNSVNYWVGVRYGRQLLTRINPGHLRKTEAFFEKYGGKAVVLLRFVPIVRTLGPFVAGVGRMEWKRFQFFNITGGLFWVISLTLAGVWFGEIPWIKANFEGVVLGIIAVSLLPVVVAAVKARGSSERENGQNA